MRQIIMMQTVQAFPSIIKGLETLLIKKETKEGVSYLEVIEPKEVVK